MTGRNRRSFVAAAAAVGASGLAGCLADARGVAGELGLVDTDNEPPTNETNETNGTNETDGGNETDDADDAADRPGESLDDFEDLERWVTMIDHGNLEAATDDPYAGNQSARLVAEEGTEYAGIYRSAGDGDLTGKSLSLAVRFTGRDQVQLSLELLAPGSGDAVRLRRTLTGPADRWVRIDFGTVIADGQPDLSDVQQIRLVARRRGGESGDLECVVDDLRATDHPDRGAVTFLFDATLESHYTRALDVMNEFGYAGVEAVIPEAVGKNGRLSRGQLMELSDAGWEMAARPRTGARFIHEFTPEKQKEMIQQTKAYLENNGFAEGARHFVTPRNVLGSATMDLVREHHDLAFRHGGGPTGLPFTDPHNVGHISADDDATTEFVDFAADYGQAAVLHVEQIGDGGMSEDDFRALLEHVNGSDVRVLTASELLEQSQAV